MPLMLYVTPLQATHEILKKYPIDQILSVLPKNETIQTNDLNNRFRAPYGGHRKHDWIEVADACFGETDLSESSLKASKDCFNPEEFPSYSHVEHMIECLNFARAKGSSDNWSLLIHCHGGVSRSVAAAYILLCMQKGPGLERECLNKLQSVVRQSSVMPNPLIVSLADDLLKRNGRMRNAVLTEISQQF